ncbi:mucin-2-like isoform X1 [Bolinopsis microptera]|uniref:mucin-2-like isoform X1 n=1 Tax=Bolinopsis microptera TaxID=2820187 RepID=UPI003078CDF1
MRSSIAKQMEGMFEPAEVVPEVIPDVRKVYRPEKPKLLEMAAMHHSMEGKGTLSSSPKMTRRVMSEMNVCTGDQSNSYRIKNTPVSAEKAVSASNIVASPPSPSPSSSSGTTSLPATSAPDVSGSNTEQQSPPLSPTAPLVTFHKTQPSVSVPDIVEPPSNTILAAASSVFVPVLPPALGSEVAATFTSPAPAICVSPPPIVSSPTTLPTTLISPPTRPAPPSPVHHVSFSEPSSSPPPLPPGNLSRGSSPISSPQQLEDYSQSQDEAIYQKLDLSLDKDTGEERALSYTIPRRLTECNSNMPETPVKFSPDPEIRKTSTTSYVPLSAMADAANHGPEETVYEVYRDPTIAQCTPRGKPHSHVNGNGTSHVVAEHQPKAARSPATGVSNGPPTWCSCACCSHADHTGMICCASSPELVFLFDNGEECVTNTLLFNQVVLNKLGLKYGDWVGKKWLMRKENVDHGCNRAYRHLAYNAFVNLVSSQIKKQWSHKVLPSCVINAIRKVYPSRDGAYSGIVRST